MVILDAGHNNFTGIIPTWSRKSLPYLISLSLRFNSLIENILKLSHFACLQILDLSNNDLLGSIPRSFGNFNALQKELSKCSDKLEYPIGYNLFLHIKGIEYEYENLLGLVTAIDLSSNGLSGYIPMELEKLHRLQNLNLSKNNLIGEILRSINGMRNLEVLDLSRNSLSGIIPLTLVDLNFFGLLELVIYQFLR